MRTRVLCGVPLVAAALVYWPITGSYFYLDDFLHLYQLVNEPLGKLLIEPFGGHLYTMRNLVFAALFASFGPDPRPYFGLMLATHLANVGLLFVVIRRLTGSERLACAGATLWGTSPVLDGTLGWYSAHGHALVATAMLGVLADVLRAADRSACVSMRRLAVWYAALVVGATCYGTGIGVALAFPIVAALLLPRVPGRSRAVVGLCTLWVLLPGLYRLAHYLWVLAYGGSPIGLPTQLQMMLAWKATGGMLMGLLGHGVANAHLGTLRPANGAGPLTMASLAALYLLGVALVLLRGSGPVRRQMLACVTLVVAPYLLIAIGRGNLYALVGLAGTTPFSNGGTARYHYVGLIPLVVGSCLMVARLGAGSWPGPRAKDALLLALLVVLVGGYQRSTWRIDQWETARARTVGALDTIRARIRAAPPGSDVYLPARAFAPVGGFVTQAMFPGWAALFAIFFPDDRVEDRRVHFVSGDPEVLAAARSGTRSAALLVARPAP